MTPQRMECFPEGPTPATVMLVGEVPGEQEAATGRPFVGYAGQELSRMLLEAKLSRNNCFVTNVIRLRPPGGDVGAFIAMKKAEITSSHVSYRDKFVLPVVVEGVKLLEREIELCQPHVIIAFGNVALWALTGQWGITSWRGSVLQTDLPLHLSYKPKVIPVYHPAAVLRQWSWRPFAVHDLKRAAKESVSHEFHPPRYEFITRPVLPDVLPILRQLYDQAESRDTVGKLAVDLETRAGHIACVGIAWSNHQALCIPFMCTERAEGYWTVDEEAIIVYALYKLLTHPKVEIVGQNFSYDIQYFHRHWHFLPNLRRDTLIAQHSMFSNMPKGLDVLSSLHCEFHQYWKDEGKEWHPGIDENQYWIYNCKDAVITFEVDTSQQRAVDAMGLRTVHDFQQRLFWPVVHSMLRGVRVDHAKRQSVALELQEKLIETERWFQETLGHSLNPRSSPQMQKLFYNDLGQKAIHNRKTGGVSCDDEALRKVAEREPLLKPLVDRIADYRSTGVLYSTFVQAPVDTDNRMRCSFNIGGTDTYRFSSDKNAFGSGMNMQNIPPHLRIFFLPDQGNTFFDIDLNSADLRIVVWESDEPEYKAMLRTGADPYTEIAKEFYHDPSITKKDPRRQIFKSFAHGTHYLGTARGLAERLGLSVHSAEQTQKWYFGRFPRIKKWQDDLKDQITKRRYVTNVFGYRLNVIDRIEGTIFNQVAAWIPQSTVACLINRAYANIFQNLPQVEVLLQVHDSLAGQFPTHLGDWAIREIVSQASIELPYPGDPLTIPVGVKTSTKSWGECA